MIIVCPLHAAASLVVSRKASHAISLLSPETPFPQFNLLPDKRHLKLSLHDVTISAPGIEAPRANDAQRLVDFIEEWDVTAPMLIHCWAGISRSTASAFAAMCMKRDEPEDQLAWELRSTSASATPNLLLISHVDKILGRNGRMVDAIKAIGRGEEAFEGKPLEIRV